MGTPTWTLQRPLVLPTTNDRTDHYRGHGPLLLKHQALAVGAGRTRETHPQKKEKGRQSNTPAPAPLQSKPLQPISLHSDPSHPPTDRSHAPASPAWHRPLPGGVLFFACPKKRTKRKGSPAAETTPVDGLRNRRGKNSLRSDSLPLFPGSAPRRPAQRQRAVVLPRKSILPRTVSLAGPAFHLMTGNLEGD